MSYRLLIEIYVFQLDYDIKYKSFYIIYFDGFMFFVCMYEYIQCFFVQYSYSRVMNERISYYKCKFHKITTPSLKKKIV